RELRCDVSHRAVVLAELRTGAGRAGGVPGLRPGRADLTGRRSVTLPGQDGCQGLRLGRGSTLVEDLLPVRVDERRDAPLGERANRVLTDVLGEEPDRGDRQVVVGMTEPRPALLGEQEQLRGPA